MRTRKHKIARPFKDYSQQQVGPLFINRFAEERSKHLIHWEYKCECGRKGYISSSNLAKGVRMGRPFSCGCRKGCGSRSDARQDVIGKTYDRLTIKELFPSPRRTKVRCVCDCGTEIICTLNGLRSGNTRSCGCLQKEKASKHALSCPEFKDSWKTNWNARHKWHYVRGGKKIRMRSGYEVMFAGILDRRGVKWQYEPKVFKLQEGMRYCPDFYVPANDEWFEVKGYMRPESKRKVDKFREQGHKLTLVYLDDIESESPISYRLFRKRWAAQHKGAK